MSVLIILNLSLQTFGIPINECYKQFHLPVFATLPTTNLFFVFNDSFGSPYDIFLSIDYLTLPLNVLRKKYKLVTCLHLPSYSPDLQV